MRLPGLLFMIFSGLHSATTARRSTTLGWGDRRISTMNLPQRAPSRKLARDDPAWVKYRRKYGSTLLLLRDETEKIAGKKYRNETDEEMHAMIFEDTSLFVEEHNAAYKSGAESYEIGINKFADMTEDEFFAMNGLTVPDEVEDIEDMYIYDGEVSRDVYARRKREIPKHIDWRHLLGPVKNQGRCGSCYAFAAIAPLEAAIARRDGNITTLSEQEAVDCSVAFGNRGCKGGWPTRVYELITNNSGVSAQDAYTKYHHSIGKCNSTSSDLFGAISSFTRIKNQSSMELALGTVGPVAAAIEGRVRTFHLYKSGIYNDPTCGAGSVDHTVTLVGYGSENGTEFYYLRNSWGKKWGQNGYMKIARTIRHLNRYGYYPNLA